MKIMHIKAINSRLRRGIYVAMLCSIGTIGVSADVVFEEDFNDFRDGEQPTSIVELKGRPWMRGEVVGKRYAINAGGNTHRLVMPQVSDFDLTFTAEPHERAIYAPILIINFRQGPGRGGHCQL